MNFKQKINGVIAEMKLTNFTDKMLCKKLNMNSVFEKTEVSKVLRELVRDGELLESGKGKYVVVAKTELIKGTLRGNRKGFAFLIREDGGADMFIPHSGLKGAQHGDTVFAKKVPKTVDEAEVVSVYKRGYTSIVGTFYPERAGFGFVVSLDDSYFSDIFIPADCSLDATAGSRVVAEITDFGGGKNPVGNITEILGQENTVKGDTIAILRSHGFKESFSEAQKKEADFLSKTDILVQFGRRDDFRELTTITIDGDDARDFDDAVSLKVSDKGYQLYVHIADVANYIKAGSPLDKEALERATSVYFPNMVVPMLPEAISNGCCSLVEGEDRLTLTAVMYLDKNAKVINQKICESVIRSNRRMTYSNVTKMLEGDEELIQKYADIAPMIKDMLELSQKLTAARNKRGSIDFATKESKITVVGEAVTNIEKYPYDSSNRIIEEFMLLANETVAEFMFNTDFPFVYRVHEAPTREKMEIFQRFVANCGFKFPLTATTHGTQLQKLLDEVKGAPTEFLISKIMLRSMQKAKYSTVNSGHFGLALENYCHFTSPIRRYPDLMIHRVIKHMLSGKFNESSIEKLYTACENAALISSERERAADLAERDADDYFKALYMTDKLGEVFAGYVSGVTAFGIFVELENTVEGMVAVQRLPEDNYVFEAENYKLKGKSHSFTLGDAVTVKVAAANTQSRRVDFDVYEEK